MWLNTNSAGWWHHHHHVHVQHQFPCAVRCYRACCCCCYLCRCLSSPEGRVWVMHSTCLKSSTCTPKSSCWTVCVWLWEVGSPRRSSSDGSPPELRTTSERSPRAPMHRSEVTQVAQVSTPSQSPDSQIWTHRHEPHVESFRVASTSCGYHYLWCPSRIKLQKSA